MATARDIIQDSMEKIGVYAAGETMSDADAERGLTVLNDMLDRWSNESLACFAISTQTGTLIVGQSAYTIGSGGNFNITRPLRLIDGPGTAYVTDSNNNRYAVSVVPEDKWNLIGNVGNTVTSNFPDTLWYDPQYPLGTLNFFPTPNISYVATWTSYLQLTDFSTLTTAVSLPPGYLKALKDDLALELIPYFMSAPPPNLPLLVAAQSKSISAIKRTNIRPVEAVYDPELVSRATSTYNIYTDRSGGLS